MEKYIKTYFETYLKDFDFDSIFLETGADSPHLNFVTDLIEWMMENPDLAEKHFPGRLEKIYRNLNKVIDELPVHYALSIQSLAKEFPKWKTEVNDFFGISKTKKILSYLETIGYFLDKNEYINELEQDIIESVRPELEEHFEYWTKELETIAQQQDIGKPKGLSISQIAIIHNYNNSQITRANADELAKLHNHTSGEKLFQQYCFYSSATNRKGKPTPCTPTKLKNKIELFESILLHLNDSAKQRANDEIKILKTIYENEY